MLDHVMFVYDFNLRHARHLVSDLTPEQCVAQPGNLRNHVAWTIGHLALASEVVALEFDAEPIFPEAWMPRFMPGAEIVGG
ncbi:MAG: DinB family protein, partial [Phycisphaerales bacterium]